MSNNGFKDLFSSASGDYKNFRPQYPPEVFEWLAGISPGTELVWDCGCGNGQASSKLAALFQQVIATDPSPQQLEHAWRADNIEYRCETAEHSTLPEHSADLVTIAQALHWFDFDKFYQEVRRVLKPGGIICAIAYGLPSGDPAIIQHIRHLHNEILGPYWEQERQLVADLYKDIPFPFPKIEAPDFYIRRNMTKEEILGYLGTWSGLKKYVQSTGSDPLPAFSQRLAEIWPVGQHTVELAWKLAIMAGRV